MTFNDYNFLKTVIGMPESHARAFSAVAMQEQCVIMVRATGPTCLGLLEEGYDTKGYRIHGKSCDWGPMAGFVMRDPRLNKYGMGKAGFNRDKHAEAIDKDSENQGWTASATPLKISDKRINWLKGEGKINVTAKTVNGEIRYEGVAQHPSGIQFDYILAKDASGIWGVYLDYTKSGWKFKQELGSTVVRIDQCYKGNLYGMKYEPMMAMTNPEGHGSGAGYLRAITGDYDLFAVWPYEKDYDASKFGDDHRPLGTVHGSNSAADRHNVEHLENKFTITRDETGKMKWQGTKLGNITNRIYRVCQFINSRVGRSVLWHSDEAARPFLDDVDLPVIAFTPRGYFVAIRDITDFKKFIADCEVADIHVTLSDAWAQNPTAKHKNRLGAEYSRYVPADGFRYIVPDWYNR